MPNLRWRFEDSIVTFRMFPMGCRKHCCGLSLLQVLKSASFHLSADAFGGPIFAYRLFNRIQVFLQTKFIGTHSRENKRRKHLREIQFVVIAQQKKVTWEKFIINFMIISDQTVVIEKKLVKKCNVFIRRIRVGCIPCLASSLFLSQPSSNFTMQSQKLSIIRLQNTPQKEHAKMRTSPKERGDQFDFDI